MLITKEIMQEAHARTKEMKKEYPSIDYQLQLGLFISYLLEEEKNNKDITIDDWIEDYYSNGLYGYILHKNNILEKNGKRSTSQKVESNTSAFYNILPSDVEDIEQLALLKVVEKFEREGGTIQNKHRFSTWSMACLNATKEYTRNLAKFRPNQKLETHATNGQEVGWDGENLTVTTIDNINYLQLELEQLVKDGELSPRHKEITDLKDAGYNNTEIADIIGISRQAIHNNINKIQFILIENGLAIGY